MHDEYPLTLYKYVVYRTIFIVYHTQHVQYTVHVNVYLFGTQNLLVVNIGSVINKSNYRSDRIWV